MSVLVPGGSILSPSPDYSDLFPFGREAEDDQVSGELLAYFVLDFHTMK